MATNPLYQSNNSPNNSTQPTKAVNRQGVYIPRTHNTFDMSYPHKTTQRFGFYEPFFVMEGVPGDMIPMSCEQSIQTLPMVSSFKDHVTLNKDYFLVPNQAIQPNTWEYIYKHPAQGDDVPQDAYNVFPLWFGEGNSNYLLDRIVNGISSAIDVKEMLEYCLIAELFFSSGSLLHKVGYRLNPIVYADDVRMSFDTFFDNLINSIDTFSISVDTEDLSFYHTHDSIDKYTFVSLLRQFGSDATFEITASSIPGFIAIENLPHYREDYSNRYINMDRVCAYQLSCWQYYVNPQIDFMYNAQLWRDNLSNLRLLFSNPSQDYPTLDTFEINGIAIPYDHCSLHYYHSLAYNHLEDSSRRMRVYDYLSALFGYNNTLKFGDYLTDSRTRPLAIGNDIVSLTDGGVSVIDMSKNIIYQRFRNAVIKLGNNFGDYLKGIFGTSPSPDYHFPKYIVHQEVGISGFDTANSVGSEGGANQGYLTHQLSTTQETNDFAVEIDMPCILIGISYFSIPVSYMQTKDRQFFHKDRFDFFNTALQQIGDQIVYNNERTDLRPAYEIFGYQSRYNEYKQRLPIATGAFVSGNQLGSWSFIIDSLFAPNESVQIANVQSPDFIRHHDYEFNRFFPSVAGYSLANGFHFIVTYNNKVVCNRPMEVNPNTL